MSFRSRKFLQGYEYVRYQLDEVIRLPGNNQHQQKMDINTRLMIVVLFTTGIMHILKCNFSFNNLQTALVLQMLPEPQ